MDGCCELCGCCCMDDLTTEERESAVCIGDDYPDDE